MGIIQKNWFLNRKWPLEGRKSAKVRVVSKKLARRLVSRLPVRGPFGAFVSKGPSSKPVFSGFWQSRKKIRPNFIGPAPQQPTRVTFVTECDSHHFESELMAFWAEASGSSSGFRRSGDVIKWRDEGRATRRRAEFFGRARTWWSWKPKDSKER